MIAAVSAPLATLFSSASGGETGKVLLDILIILVAAKLAAELAERIRIPTVVGEIAAGIFIGPSVLHLVKTGNVLDTLAELGVILLLLEVGMHMDLRELKTVGRAALRVAVVGVVLPFAGAMLICPLLGMTSDQTLFAAAALTATSVGITARVFGDLRALASVEARTVLGAAVADDVLGLIILTVVVRMVTGDGAVTIQSIGTIIATAAIFLVVCTAAGTYLAPRLFAWIDRHARSSASLFALALAFALGIAQLASLAQLAPIIGAFVAGLSLGRSEPAARIQRELTPVGHLFIPVFFLQIGINVHLGAFAKSNVLGIAGALTVVAIIGKVAAGWAIGSLKADRLTVGLGMIPRGEVGLIFASIGLAAGIFTQDLYAAVLLMVLVTTLITPPLLGWRAKQLQRAQLAANDDVPTDEPMGGWLVAYGEELTLAGVPAADQLLAIALPAARSIAEGRVPSEDLVQWIARTAPTATVNWTPKSTASLMHLLQHSTNRSWRFLEVTGVLEFALPELAKAIQSRRSNAMVLDPMGVHRWPTMERIKALLPGNIVHADQLLLTALLIDTCTDDIDSARAVLDRLGLDQSERDRIGRMFVDAQLFRGTALRPDGLTEDSVLRLAVHIGDQAMADELLALSNTTDSLETWERAALTELHRLVTATLAASTHGGATAEILERRRNEVRSIVSTQINPEIRTAALARVESAPVTYLLSNDAQTAARHAILITQLKRRGQVAASVIRNDAADKNSAIIDIATLDVTGLLARSTGVLEALGLTIEDAAIATWVDGIAVQSFTVRSLSDWLPTAEDLETELTSVIDTRLQSSPVPDAILIFDNTASPWHTVCTLRATDRPGVLHAVAAAMATCGVDIHAATISTEDELVLDLFQLTDARNAKLNVAIQEEVRQAISRGVTSGRDGSLRHRRKKRDSQQTRNTTETIR